MLSLRKVKFLFISSNAFFELSLFIRKVELILAKETKDKIVLLAEASRKRIHKEAEIYIAGDIVKFIIR